MNTPSINKAKIRNKEIVNKINYEIDDKYLNIGKNKTYYIKTYGCQMNERDSENICAMLESIGYSRIDKYEDADFIILNTCAIRENVHNKVFGMLGRIKHLKETKEDVIVGVCGCMSQEEIVVNKIKDKYKWINFVFGTHNLHKLPEIIFNSINNNRQEIDVWSKEGDIVEGIPIHRENKYKAWVNIIYGCDKFCTYCIVPFTRGKERSRDKEDIINEVKELVKEGYKEVTLLGQNVNAYGKDKYDNYNMSNLLNDISKTNIERIKFVTSHPWDFTDDMILEIKNNKNILPYIHLPVQSGSNKILKLMGRRYTKETYLELFNKLKDNIPNCSITTDIIVGFPGETEEDFNETLDLVNECKFDSAYTFIYSPRSGTASSRLIDDISIEEKENRLYKLNEIVNKYAREKMDKTVGNIYKVLVESESNKNGMLMGYTETGKLVNLKGDISLIGKIIDVKIIESRTWSLYGEHIQ
ncbi:MAG: tRNA (N6-isopentenyl adenosine(37)-C2)-methylthiotransferase MiaB [Tenericutes bacterium]|nr:tRNA (N6-isopentenyl adenosine(37)-C2)-methylthiotransferase MiaB [Bacilli bacterium]MDD4624495.1 tRNA (N6-isopentenyl adenosine(37)-C2)-methylthiotransferase MiaB [Bacilli bacterium]NLV90439.1 tRNA (N6-isopentenyl adenosine(37)-C2)-methylthiotransferase MiaB [Mycoplasmatota bacterium]